MSGQGSSMVKLTLLFIVSMKGTSCSVKPVCSEPSSPWNLLRFAMFWPPSLCMYEHRCRWPISSNITGWTIHGLWPSDNGSRTPCYCNDSWRFDVKQVQHLRPELDRKWPSTTLNESCDEGTWRREWNKHGTCATSLPDLHDEVHYFNFTLTLLQRFNLTEILAKRGVLPSTNPYKTMDLAYYITEAVGVRTNIICLPKDKDYFLEQVQICMNKTFSPVNCSRTTLPPPGQVHSDNSLRFFQEGDLISRQHLLRMKAKVQRIVHGRLGSEMRIVSITFAMFATIFFFLATGGSADPTCHRSGNPKDWDLLKLEQTWPPAFCNLSYRDNQQCIPKNVDYWVIHGLWPTKSGTRDPNCCNNSWPFHEKNVQGLRPALDNYWPDFNPRHIGPNISWRHEWEEHGTCGTILPSLRDELHYFNYTLQSYYRFNLAKIFEQQGVTPSNSPYKTQTLKDIVHKAVGAEPEFLCVKGRRTKYILLEHIVICMNKSGQVVDCPVSQLRSGQGEHDGWKGHYEDGHDRSLRFYSEINSENLHQNPEWSGADIKCPMSGSIIYLPFP